MSGNPRSPQVEELGRVRVDFSGVNCLPPEIIRLIENPGTFADPSVLECTTRMSTIARILNANPASDHMLRLVYPDINGVPLMRGLDKVLSRSLSGQALRDRLVFCSDWIAKKFVRPDARVIDLGGGSGSYAFVALRLWREAHGALPQGFIWDVLDQDMEALNAGLTRAADTGLHQHVTVRQGNFMAESAVLPEKADFAVLIGVLCGMDKDTAVTVLKRIKIHLKPNAEILAATLLQKAFDEDPRTFRILCNVGGWQLRPKTLGQVIEVFQSSGWDIIGDIMSERDGGNGQYAIVHARAL
jgi:hypothetical protein